MKAYVSIGHFKDDNNITVVAMTQNSLKDFRTDLAFNEFIPYIATTAKTMKELIVESTKDIFTEQIIFNKVKKLTTNYRKWNEISDYIYQCYDIIERRIRNAELNEIIDNL